MYLKGKVKALNSTGAEIVVGPGTSPSPRIYLAESTKFVTTVGRAPYKNTVRITGYFRLVKINY